jgi:hypothetical protein
MSSAKGRVYKPRSFYANTSSQLIGDAEPIGHTESGLAVYLVVAFPWLYLFTGKMESYPCEAYNSERINEERSFNGKVLHKVAIGDFLQESALVTAERVVDRSGTVLTPYWSERSRELQGILPRLSMDTLLRYVTLESGSSMG